MKAIIKIEILSEDWIAWTGLAISKGFQRDEPRKRWVEKEVKEAAQFVMSEIVKEAFAKYCERGDAR